MLAAQFTKPARSPLTILFVMSANIEVDLLGSRSLASLCYILCYFEAPSGEVHQSLAITRRAFIYAHSQTFRETHLDAAKQLNDEF